MCDIRFFRRAYLDYRAAVNLLNVPENDEAYMNAVGNAFEWNCLYQIYHRKLASDAETI